jgi:hypothetical protein
MCRMRTRVVTPLHVGDLRIQACAPTREACRGGGARPRRQCRRWHSGACVDRGVRRARRHRYRPADRSARTVIFRVRTWSEVPVTTEVVPTADGLRLHCAMVDMAAVVPVGVVPKVSPPPERGASPGRAAGGAEPWSTCDRCGPSQVCEGLVFTPRRCQRRRDRQSRRIHPVERRPSGTSSSDHSPHPPGLLPGADQFDPARTSGPREVSCDPDGFRHAV